MKKRDIKTLALMGLTSGLIVSAQSASAASSSQSPSSSQLLANHSCKNGCGNTYMGCSSCKAADHACKGKNGCGNTYMNCSSCKGVTAMSCSSCKNLTADRDNPSDNTPFQSPGQQNSKSKNNPNDQNIGYHLLTEDELLMELNSDGVKMYNSLTPEGKALARQVASARCQNTNACKGLNACQTPRNSCAGKGSCKGTGACAIADKNLAVKLVYDKMMKEKRLRAQDQ